MKLEPENQLHERPFSVEIDGMQIRSICHLPQISNGLGVVLFPAGYKYRAGPHDFYVALARKLVQRGTTVLRVDYPGLAYSEGPLPMGPVYEARQRVEDGHFVQPSILAVQAFKKAFGLEAIFCGGICGGAMTSQIAAAERPDLIQGILAINAPVTRTKSPTESRKQSHQPIDSETERVSYLHKLTSKDAWRRLLGGRSDYLSILNTWLPGKKGDQGLDQVSSTFLLSWKACIKHQTKMLLVFGGKDSRWQEFNSYFLRPYLKAQMRGLNYQVEVIENANHELFYPEWQASCINLMEEFLGNALSNQISQNSR